MLSQEPKKTIHSPIIVPLDSFSSQHSVGDRLFQESPRTRTVVGNRRMMYLGIMIVAIAAAVAVRWEDVSNRSSTTFNKGSIFDVNGPPPSEGGLKLRKEKQKQANRLASIDDEGEDLMPDFPVIRADDEKIPEPSGGGTQRAADALVCRQSVINFVINATDNKDECTGLKKAFEKTCSNDAIEEKEDKDAAGNRRRRLLSQKRANKNSWYLFWYQSALSVRDLVRWWLVPPKDFFFSDEELVGDAWETARYEVENDLDLVLFEDIRRRLEAPDPKEVKNATNVTKHGKTPTKPQVSLSLPTSSQHVSDKVLSETLMLQQEGKVIENARKAKNQTNTTRDEAKNDAAASSKAVADTNALLEAVLNDPDSVEARTCCTSILHVYHENCDVDDEEDLSDSRLFIIVVVMAMCGIVKSLIRHFHVHWLPEAAGCILVGVVSGGILSYFPHKDLSFDGNWFLRILVPPIVFEAALGIDKRSFNRHIVPILFYAVVGTLLATCLTATILHKATSSMSGCETIPYIDSLVFGALISSIDPIAVLSVLSNMGMTDTDTIYVVIFGESLLNDGVAIVLFQTLVHFLDESIVIDSDTIIAAAFHFVVVALGSLLVGVASGLVSTVYYWAMYGCQTPLVECLMFMCWALLPYYICDGIGWSGIVSVVATGFVMDLHVVGQKSGDFEDMSDDSERMVGTEQTPKRKGQKPARRRDIFSKEGHLSDPARTHIGFVTEILSTLMETAIFAYLGLFLFSSRYHWNAWHSFFAILACCLSRAAMIPTLSMLANWITRIQQSRAVRQTGGKKTGHNNPAGVVIDRKMQLVLWFAGLRGAMSFALVEHVPLYDTVTGEGSRVKAELKAMTSASILFTVFVLGGGTFYMMEYLGISPSTAKQPSSFEMVKLLDNNGSCVSDEAESDGDNQESSFDMEPAPAENAFRQRIFGSSENIS